MDDDRPAGRDVMPDEIERPLDALKRTRVVRLLGVEEAPGLRRIGQTAADEDLREHVPDPQLALQGERLSGRVGRDLQPGNRSPGRRRVNGQPQRRRLGPASVSEAGSGWASAAA